ASNLAWNTLDSEVMEPPLVAPEAAPPTRSLISRMAPVSLLIRSSGRFALMYCPLLFQAACQRSSTTRSLSVEPEVYQREPLFRLSGQPSPSSSYSEPVMPNPTVNE